jgi:hypothetical protein
MRLEVIHGSRVVPKDEQQAILVRISQRMRANREREEQVRALARRPSPDDSADMLFLTKVIEQHIVRGLWVIELSQALDGPRPAKRHGLEHLREREDHFAAGQWIREASSPALPSSREIDAAERAKSWLRYLDEGQAKLLNVAALTKRGEWNSGVKWDAVKEKLIHLRGVHHSTLKDRYQRALRTIAAELTIQRLEAEQN